jgi:hypothetical protein
MDWYAPTCYASEILDAEYENMSIDDIDNQITHLSNTQK